MILFGELQFWMNDQNSIATMRRESATLLREVVRSAAEQEAVAQKRPDSILIAVDELSVKVAHSI